MSSNSYKIPITRETSLVDWILAEKKCRRFPGIISHTLIQIKTSLKKGLLFSKIFKGIDRFVQLRNETGDYVPGGLRTLGPEDGVGGLDTVLGLVTPVVIEGKEYRARNAVSYVYRKIAR